MASVTDLSWFMEAEYHVIREWIMLNEKHYDLFQSMPPGIALPEPFVSFETFWLEQHNQRP